MSEFVPDRRTPLYLMCSDFDDAIFPRARAKVVLVLDDVASRLHAVPQRWQAGTVLLRRLRGLRSDRQLERYLAERVGLKDLISLRRASIFFLQLLAQRDVDDPFYQRARELIGRKPTRLKFLRAALRFWIEQGE